MAVRHENVERALKRLKPVRVHWLDKIGCANETARLEFKCCDPYRMKRAALLNLTFNRKTPFSSSLHAHGALSYLHIRQGFRDVRAHERWRGKEYDWIVRTRPDVLPMLPMSDALFQRLPRKVMTPFKIHYNTGVYGTLRRPANVLKKYMMVADWFVAVPRERAEWFFEAQLLGIFEASDRDGRNDRGWNSAVDNNCINGGFYHAPEVQLTARLRDPKATSDATTMFPIAILRKRAAAGFTRVCHYIPGEHEKHGAYELECSFVPTEFRRRCWQIDGALHRATAGEIERVESVEGLQQVVFWRGGAPCPGNRGIHLPPRKPRREELLEDLILVAFARYLSVSVTLAVLSVAGAFAVMRSGVGRRHCPILVG